MFDGFLTGIVKDNVDPEKMHRVLVELPVDSVDKKTESYWCRVATPMAGAGRGLVILPEIGTEVVLSFSYKSLTPYIIGAVYNGAEDKPEVYRNDDEENNKRVFWSRNDHMVIFDDTKGEEKVEIGAQAPTRLDVTSAPIYQSLDSSKMTIKEYCDGDTNWEARSSISIKCTDFELNAARFFLSTSLLGNTSILTGGVYAVVVGGTNHNLASQIHVNSGYFALPKSPRNTPLHKHPPSKVDPSESAPPAEGPEAEAAPPASPEAVPPAAPEVAPPAGSQGALTAPGGVAAGPSGIPVSPIDQATPNMPSLSAGGVSPIDQITAILPGTPNIPNTPNIPVAPPLPGVSEIPNVPNPRPTGIVSAVPEVPVSPIDQITGPQPEVEYEQPDLGPIDIPNNPFDGTGGRPEAVLPQAPSMDLPTPRDGSGQTE